MHLFYQAGVRDIHYFSYGIEDLLPANVRMIHGPGCPVCVLPIGRIDEAIALARDPDITLCTYADLMRVPASRGQSLMRAKAEGAGTEVKVEYRKNIDDLKAKYQVAQSKLDELKAAGSEKWETCKTGVEGAWKELEAAFGKLTK